VAAHAAAQRAAAQNSELLTGLTAANRARLPPDHKRLTGRKTTACPRSRDAESARALA